MYTNQGLLASSELLTKIRESEEFGIKVDNVSAVVEARPDIFNHNLETIPRLYSEARPGASYKGRWSY